MNNMKEKLKEYIEKVNKFKVENESLNRKVAQMEITMDEKDGEIISLTDAMKNSAKENREISELRRQLRMQKEEMEQ